MKLFTLGPVEMDNDILRISGEQLPYFRTPEFSSIELEIEKNLKMLLNAPDKSQVAILTASGTGAMEASISNVFTSKDKVLIISGGNFGERFEKICTCYDIPYDAIKIPFPQKLTKEMLYEYNKKGYTAMLVNIHETATGQLYDIDMLSKFCFENGMYFIVDAISSFLSDDFNMSRYNVDIAILSSQKGLALHPGLSFIVASERIINERIQKIEKNFLYFNLENYFLDMKRGQTPYTPAVGILLQLQERLRSIIDKGIENAIGHCKNLAVDFRKRCKESGIVVLDYPKSNACTPIFFPNGDAMDVYNSLKQKYSIYLTPNGGELANKILRVGHIGKLTLDDNKFLIEKLIQEYKKYEG